MSVVTLYDARGRPVQIGPETGGSTPPVPTLPVGEREAPAAQAAPARRPRRKPRFDRTKEAAYLALIRQEGLGREAAAERLGIHVRTVQRRLAASPSFAAEVSAAEVLAVQEIEASLYRTARAGSPRTMEFFLLNRGGGRSRSARRLELSGPAGRPVPVATTADNWNLDLLSEEQLADLERLVTEVEPLRAIACSGNGTARRRRRRNPGRTVD